MILCARRTLVIVSWRNFRRMRLQRWAAHFSAIVLLAAPAASVSIHRASASAAAAIVCGHVGASPKLFESKNANSI